MTNSTYSFEHIESGIEHERRHLQVYEVSSESAVAGTGYTSLKSDLFSCNKLNG